MKIKTRYIKKKNRLVEVRGVWLLYNFDNFIDFFWTKKSALIEAKEQNFSSVDYKDIYQVLRGDVKINIYNDPFFKKEIKIKKYPKKYYCDNCKKIIVWEKGGFQQGVNKNGGVGTYCSKKCAKDYNLTDK